MKKLLVPIMVLALVALTVPVWAHQNTDGRSETQCNISLDGDVQFDKCVTIKQFRCDDYFTRISVCFEPDARADAEAVKNDSNHDNTLRIGLQLYDPSFTDTMCNSFNDFTGIGQSNQSAGSMNNQGNVVAVAYVSNAKTYASSLAAVGDKNYDNNITYSYSLLCPTTQTDTMDKSFSCFTGIGQSNQSAGSLNNQNNAVAIAAGVGEKSYGGYSDGRFGGDKGSAVAVAASELALNNCGNSMDVCGKVVFSNSMTNSFNGFTGIGQSNQSAGNMNNQVNVISVAASVSK